MGGGGILCSEYVKIPVYRHSVNWCLHHITLMYVLNMPMGLL